MSLGHRRLGAGPLLLCHPGGPGFDGDELGNLGGLDATRELLLLDPRGSKRGSPADSFRLEDYVADLEELRAALDLETVDLLGYSHGGLVAAAYAAAFPARVRKLVVASGLIAVTAELEAAAAERLERCSAEPWFPEVAAALEREQRGEYATPGDAAAMWNAMIPVYFAHWDERYRARVEADWLPPAPLLAFNADPPDIRGEVASVTAETLVITGREDFVCGPVAAETIAAAIPHAEVVLLADAGHFTYLEQPEAFRAAVEAFLGASM